MGIIIEDGKGRGFSAAVDADNHLQADTFTLSRIGKVSKFDGQTYVWSSRYLIAAGSSIIYLQNTSTTKNLIIDEIDVGASSGATWELWTSTSDGGGTVISGNNLNLTSSNAPDSRAFGDANITSNTSGVLLGYTKHGNMGLSDFDVKDSLILGQNDAIMVKKQPTPASTVSGVAFITGYFE